MAAKGQALTHAPQPLQRRADSSKGGANGSSCSSSFRVHAATAGQQPEPPLQSAGSQRVKSTWVLLSNPDNVLPPLGPGNGIANPA